MLLGAIALAMFATGCHLGEDSTDTTATTSPEVSSGLATSTQWVCSVVTGATVTQAVKDFLARETGETGLLTDIVMSGISAYCPKLAERGVLVVKGIVASLDKPSTAQADTSAFEQTLETSAQSNEVVRELSYARGRTVTPLEVSFLSEDFCGDLQGRRASNVGHDLESLLPGSEIRSLPTLNRLMGLVLRQCTPQLAGVQMQALSTAVVSVVSANTYTPRDVTPPVVLTPTAQTEGSTMTVRWGAIDPGGGEVVRYELWESVGRSEYRLVNLQSPSSASAVLTVTPGYSYQFAVAAFDAAGNKSSFAYSLPVTAA